MIYRVNFLIRTILARVGLGLFIREERFPVVI